MLRKAVRQAVIGSAAVSMSIQGPALAQSDRVLEEVLVTVARRTQALSDVPSNLMAYSSESLENKGIESFGDLNRIVPGLAQANFEPARGGWGGALPIMRGMNANSLQSRSPNVAAPTVSIYYGNTLLPSGMYLTDLDRVEVLRGPQGTLYGSGSLAGTIQVVPAGVNLQEDSLELKGDLSSFENAGAANYGLEAIANWAINDELGIRFLAGTSHRAGFIDETRLVQLDGPNVPNRGLGYSSVGVPVGGIAGPNQTFGDSDVNDTDMDYYRFKIRYEPTDTVSLGLSYDNQKFSADHLAADNPEFQGLEDYEGTMALLVPSERELDVLSLDAEVDFGFATLSINASDYSDEAGILTDWTQSAQNTIGRFYFAPYGLPLPQGIVGTAFDFSGNDGKTVELVLRSNGDEKFNWVTGFFYTEQEQDFFNEYFVPGIVDYADSVGSLWPFRPPTFPDAEGVPDDLLYEFVRQTEFEEQSVFIDVDYNLTERWEVAAGIRYFRQDFSVDGISYIYGCNVFCSSSGDDPRGENPVQSSEDFSDHVLRISTNYALSDDLRAYFNISEGFRRGGANAVATEGVLVEPENLLTFEPDSVTSYELGLRGETGSFTFTTDVYYMDWKDPQIEGITPSGNWYAVINANSARTYGFDFEASGSLTDNVSISAGYAYVNAELDEDFSVPASGRPYEGFAGDKLPGVPEHSLNLSLDWFTPGVIGSWDGLLTTNVSYRSEVWTDFESNGNGPGINNPAYELDGFSIWNGAYTLSNEDASVTLFVENILGERGVTTITPVTSAADTVNANFRAFVSRPRMIGLRVSYAFR